MATIQLSNNFVNNAVDTPEPIFTAGTTDVVIEALTITNNSTVNASYRVYIKTAEGDLIPQIPFTILVWQETPDVGIGVVNQAIPAGGQLLVEASALSSIYFTATGRN
jgi:hypothetical protein